MEAFLKGGAKPSSSSSKREKAAPTKKTEGRSVPWVEKYRPKIVSDIAHQEEVVSVLQKCVSGADLPNLLFYGPPGTGKTSAILAVARQLYGPEQMRSRMLELNASDERGIKVVREKVKSFARQAVSGTGPDGKPCPNFKLIVLDEADSMTSAAQAALRRTMEKQSKTTRFCLICNYISRIIEPLTSRCSKFRFKPLSSDILTERLQHISQTEGIACQPEVIERIINVSEGDMRKAITLLQSAHRLKGGSRGLTLADVDEIAGVAPEEVIQQLLKACYSDSYAALETCLKDIMAEGYSAYQLLSQLHDEVITSEKVANKPKSIIVERMGLVEKRLMDGGDEYLQLMDICCAMMSQFCHPTED